MINRRHFVALGLAVATLATGPALAAEGWPTEKPIMLIVPFPPGGGVDQMARLIVPYVQKQLPGANIVIENRPGAGSQIGMEYGFAAAPDGYTLIGVTSPAMMTIPFDRPVRYKVDEFSYIANVMDDPGAIAVKASSDIKDLPDLIARLKASPESVSIGHTGVGGDDHLTTLELQQAAGVKFNVIPFNGSAPVNTALQGGHIDVSALNVSEFVQPVADGTVRVLAQAGDERSASLPDVPTFRESGYAFTVGAQRGVVAPPGVPADIQAKLVAAFKAAMEDPEFKETAKKLNAPVHGLYGDEYRKSVLGIDARLNEMWKTNPWKTQ
ncbi:tripartite-type tricarboxylate transporter receptor subunit TctC [Ancylobacter aquaticus]|uniref:Tripartite-type tricarboxylate transporter receptor subunit TctC n=1 Tax=Ancylobacter aquaticus TaxID=100 RepID=A0A4R1H844_ANCAQ|nr:tripartite tricarboxylate transporter substrate binding protein [Ancylobacter aquaticus]TCK16583.1 tripartite-type tricarboxylate transporter receptor subunit TctC [Ancylobacter aquaticus]